MLTVDAKGGTATVIAPGAVPVWSNDGAMLALRDEPSGDLVVAAPGGSKRVLAAGAHPLHMRWAQDNRSIAFAAIVPDSLAWHDSAATAATLATRVSGAGGAVHLFVVDVATGAVRRVTNDTLELTESPSSLDRQFDWLTPGALVVGVRRARSTMHMASAIVSIDIATGGVRTLTTAPGFWHAPAVSPDGRSIAYEGFPETRASYRNQDLWVMRADGSAARVVTAGLDRDVLGARWSDNQTLWFTAQDRGTVNTYTTNLKNGRTRAASNGAHRFMLGGVSDRAGIGVGVRSTPKAPDEVFRFPLGKPWELAAVTTLHMGSESAALETEEIEFRSSGGALVHGWLSRPLEYEPSRAWPLVVMLHDGPHAMADAGFNSAVVSATNAGYLVLRLNPRGSTGYGTDHAAQLATFPSVDIDDVLAGIDALIAQGGVDTAHVHVRACGSGAVTAMGLMARSSRFAATALACDADGPASGERIFSRSFRVDALDWLMTSPVRDVGRMHTPVLAIARASELRSPIDQRALLVEQLILRNVPAAWVEAPRGAGPAGERDIERRILRWFEVNSRR